MAASQAIVPYTLMCRELWRRLPRELLPLVLARLPMPEIARFGCHLFKEWTMQMEFNRACDEANPNMAVLLFSGRESHEFSVRIFDFSKYIWLYEYRFHLTNRGNPPRGVGSNSWMPMVGDGGLVCFVSTWVCTEANPLCIVVVNLLTRVQHELPPLQHVYFSPRTLVYMKVDSATKGYKVVVVNEREDNCFTVEIYDSVSREWNRAVPSRGHIFGRMYEWTHQEDLISTYDFWLCAFDFEEWKLQDLARDFFFSERTILMKYGLAGDRMFVLHKKFELGFYCITEYESQHSAEVWVPVGGHEPFFPEEDDDYVLGFRDSFDLHACEDFLMIRDLIHSSIFNFSTREWHNLPADLLEDQDILLMCRVSWNVIP